MKRVLWVSPAVPAAALRLVLLRGHAAGQATETGPAVARWAGGSGGWALAPIYLALLLALSVAVHYVLPAGPALVATPAAAEPSGAATEALALEARTEARPDASPEIESAATSPAEPAPVPAPAAASAFSLESIINSSTGSWIMDWDRGRVARLDRGPIPRESGLVPILMYHYVRPIDFSRSTAATADLTVPPSQLELQLRYLRDKGFQSVSTADLWLYFQGRRNLPPRSVIFTFDDGYRDNYQYAYPLLVRYGFSGTFFIITGFVGQSEYMTWQQLREMVAAGMEIGSHSVSHPDLAHITPAQLDSQLTESKRVLQENLGVAIRALAYPSGSFSREAQVAAARIGYTIAVTTQYGATQERTKMLELPRVRIHGTDNLSLFRWRIEQYFPAGGPPSS